MEKKMEKRKLKEKDEINRTLERNKKRRFRENYVYYEHSFEDDQNDFDFIDSSEHESSLEEKNEENGEQVEENGEQVEENGEEVEDNREQVEYNREQVEENGKEVEENGKEVEDNREQVEYNREQVEENGKEVEENGKEVEDNREQVEDNRELVVFIEDVFNKYELSEKQKKALLKVFHKKKTTEAVKLIFEDSNSNENWVLEKERIESSPIFEVISKVLSNNPPNSFEKKVRKFPYNFKFCKNDNFEDNAIFTIFAKKNKTTNNSNNQLLKETLSCFLTESINWERFSIQFTKYFYCVCNGTYNFYNSNTKKCVHNKNLNSLHFISIPDVVGIISKILSNEENYEDIFLSNKEGKDYYQKETFTDQDKIFDIKTGLIMRILRNNGYYKLADFCCTLIYWTDTFTLENGVKIGAVLGSLSELHYSRRSKEQNIIPICVWVSYFPTHHTLFKPVVEYLKSLFYDKNLVNFYHYKIVEGKLRTFSFENCSIKVLGIGFNKDKGFIFESLFVKSSGYMSCCECLELGEYKFGAVHFNSTLNWPKRTENWRILCDKMINTLGVTDYGGHVGESEWNKLEQFDTFSVLNTDDSMHDFEGITDWIYGFLPEEVKNKLKNLDNFIKLTKETTGKNVGFSRINKFNTKDKINMLVFYLGICLYSIEYDHEIIQMIYSFSEIYNLFNSKKNYLNIKELDVFWREKIFKLVNKCSPLITKKLHSLKHYSSHLIKRGLFWNWSAFIFESFFNSLKKVSRDCTVNSYPAIANFLDNLTSLNLFNSLTKEKMEQFNIQPVKQNYIEKNLLKIPKRRSCTTILPTLVYYTTTGICVKKNFGTIARDSIEGVQITIEKYSKKHLTSNHFVLLLHQNTKYCAKIIAMNTKFFYCLLGEIDKKDEKTLHELFNNSVQKVSFPTVCTKIKKNQFLKKVVAFEIKNYSYFLINT